MATIEKRQNESGDIGYRAKVRLKGHPVETATFQRLTDAKLWVQQTEAAIREGRHFKSAKSKKCTLTQLIERYTKEILDLSGRDTYNQRLYLKYWKQELGDYVLADVTPSLISDYRNRLIGSINRYGKKLSPTSANRYLTALGHVFTIAVKQWELLESNPVHRIQKLKEPRGRVRFLSDDERNALLQTCKESDNPYLYLIVVLALSTGARKGELLTLKWQDVSLERRLVTLHETKNGERRALPIQGYGAFKEAFKTAYEAAYKNGLAIKREEAKNSVIRLSGRAKDLGHKLNAPLLVYIDYNETVRTAGGQAADFAAAVAMQMLVGSSADTPPDKTRAIVAIIDTDNDKILWTNPGNSAGGGMVAKMMYTDDEQSLQHIQNSLDWALRELPKHDAIGTQE